MTFKLSSKSRTNLLHVHPKLSAVVYRAIQLTETDFGVSEGLRTVERQEQLFKEGKTQTLQSKHLIQCTGYGHAVDLFVLVNGKVSWQHKDFRKVTQAMFTAAISLGTQITAGSLWRDFQDSPHFELNTDWDLED